MKGICALLMCAGLGLGTHAPAYAELADRQKPMHIEADQLQHDEKERLTTFTGRIHAVKGTMTFRGEHLTVREDDVGLQIMQVTALPGQRVFFRQKREGLNEYIEGYAEKADFDQKQDQLTLSGLADLRVLRGSQLADRIQAPRIVYNNVTEVFKAQDVEAVPAAPTPLPSRARVRAVLVPKEDAAAKPVAPASKLRLREAEPVSSTLPVLQQGAMPKLSGLSPLDSA